MPRSNHFRVLLGASVAALVVLLVTVSATQKPAQAAFPGENGKFLYYDEADRDAPCEIISINPDGSDWMQLTFLPLDLYTHGDTDPDLRPMAIGSLSLEQPIRIETSGEGLQRRYTPKTYTS